MDILGPEAYLEKKALFYKMRLLRIKSNLSLKMVKPFCIIWVRGIKEITEQKFSG